MITRLLTLLRLILAAGMGVTMLRNGFTVTGESA